MSNDITILIEQNITLLTVIAWVCRGRHFLILGFKKRTEKINRTYGAFKAS